jgi:hypothetical protein
MPRTPPSGGSEQQAYQRRLDELARSYDARLERERDRAEHRVEKVSKAHDREREKLRDQADRIVERAKEGFGEAYSLERSRHRAEEERLKNDGYDRKGMAIRQDAERLRQEAIAERDLALDREGERSLEKERYLNTRNQQLLDDLREESRRELREASDRAREERLRLKAEYQRDVDSREERLESEKKRSETVLTRQANDAAQGREEALERQRQAFQNTLSRERERSGERISRLSEQLSFKETTDDVREISPAAEESVRKAVGGEYEKKFEADHARDRATLAGIERSYGRRLGEELRELENRSTSKLRDAQEEFQGQRSELLDRVNSHELQLARSAATQELRHERQRELLIRNHSEALVQQKRRYEELLENARGDGLHRLKLTQREHQENLQAARQSFNAQRNALIQEYEKRLADQKADHEVQLARTREELGRAVRDAERNGKHAIDGLTKEYESRLSAQEAQLKERERVSVARLEDQLERMRRSHALSSKKV